MYCLTSWDEDTKTISGLLSSLIDNVEHLIMIVDKRMTSSRPSSSACPLSPLPPSAYGLSFICLQSAFYLPATCSHCLLAVCQAFTCLLLSSALCQPLICLSSAFYLPVICLLFPVNFHVVCQPSVSRFCQPSCSCLSLPHSCNVPACSLLPSASHLPATCLPSLCH